MREGRAGGCVIAVSPPSRPFPLGPWKDKEIKKTLKFQESIRRSSPLFLLSFSLPGRKRRPTDGFLFHAALNKYPERHQWETKCLAVAPGKVSFVAPGFTGQDKRNETKGATACSFVSRGSLLIKIGHWDFISGRRPKNQRKRDTSLRPKRFFIFHLFSFIRSTHHQLSKRSLGLDLEDLLLECQGPRFASLSKVDDECFEAVG